MVYRAIIAKVEKVTSFLVWIIGIGEYLSALFWRKFHRKIIISFVNFLVDILFRVDEPDFSFENPCRFKFVPIIVQSQLKLAVLAIYVSALFNA